jgi:hypothetical protein
VHIKLIKHNIIKLKSKNILILIIKVKTISIFLYIKIHFMVTFTQKNKDDILAYFSMIAPCAMEGGTYSSIVLANIIGICYWKSCLS